MVTNYPQSVAAKRPLVGVAQDARFTGRMMDWLRQTMCGLHGHDTYLQFEHDRMFLRCVSCGHESRGWELDAEPPTAQVQEPQCQALTSAPLVRERKIA